MQNKLIPSFGRCKARKLRKTSQKAYENLLPHFIIDPTEEFHKAPCDDLWLEIGFGGGEHMLEQLSQNPSISMIGCEPFMNGVATLLAHLSLEDFPRIKIWHADVRYLLEKVPPDYFTRIFILFPDPWPKKRHHKRRLITDEFITQLLSTLKAGAFLHVASDDVSYVEHMQKVLYDNPNLILREGPPSADPTTWTLRPQGWPSTRYEQKAIAQGKKCAYMMFQKKEAQS